MKILYFVFSSLLLSSLVMGIDSASSQAVGMAAEPNFCRQYNGVGYWNLPGALNAWYNACGGRLFCSYGSVADLQHEQIASYGNIAQWLWSGPSSNVTFSIAQQNAIRVQAVALANANAPPGKYLISMSFFPDLGVGGGYYTIGANLTFGNCSGPGGGPAK